MSEPKSFRYLVPVTGVKDGKRRYAKAWYTDCPGLIIQESLERNSGILELVHKNSGFRARSFESRERYHKIAKGMLSFGRVDWTAKTGKAIMLQVSKLSDYEVRRFVEILRGKIEPGFDARKFRIQCQETAKNWKKFIREQGYKGR